MQKAMAMMISLSDAGKRFNRDWIFRHFSYQFKQGSSYAITGPNGSGKSTLLQVLGASMMINEGLPMYVISRAEQQFELSEMTVGILGMAFKAESDDTRSSLAYKLRHILNFKAKNVLSADNNVKGDHSLIDEVSLVELCDLIFIGAPHKRYRSIQFTCPVVDIWNVCGNGVLI